MINRNWWIIAGWLVTTGMAQAAMYKWVDEHGVTQYTQYPPPNQQSETVAPPPPPAEDPVEARKKLDATLEAQSEQDNSAAGSEAEQAKTAADAELRKNNCATAKSNLEKLTTGGRKRVMGDDGVATYLTEEDMQARITKAKQQIEEFCD